MLKKMILMMVIEIKSYLYAYKQILFSIIAGLALGAVLWLGIGELANRGSLFEPFTVGVVDHDGTPELIFIYDFFNEHVINLEFMEKSQAEALLSAGEIPAYIELPSNFTQDVFQGINNPFMVHANSRFPLQAGLVQLLASGGIAYLSVSQAGVYATLEYAFEAGMPWDEIQRSLLIPVNIAFVQELLNYDDMFAREVLFLVEGNTTDYFIRRFAVFWYILNLIALIKFLPGYSKGILTQFKLANMSFMEVFAIKWAGLNTALLVISIFIMPIIGIAEALILSIFTTAFGLVAGRLFKRENACGLFIFFTALVMYFASGGIIPFVFLPQDLWFMRWLSVNYWIAVGF